MNFGAYDYAKKDLNELPLRRRSLYPAELLVRIQISDILINFRTAVKEKSAKTEKCSRKMNFLLYRFTLFGYNKLNYVNITK